MSIFWSVFRLFPDISKKSLELFEFSVRHSSIKIQDVCFHLAAAIPHPWEQKFVCDLKNTHTSTA